MSTAKELLNQGYTLAICLGETVYTSKERGVKTLLSFVEDKIDVSGYYCADRVVGKGAAFLYVLLNVREVHACVISRCAKEVLTAYGIGVTYDTLVDRIANRDKTGFCPIEEAVINICEPTLALNAIKEKLLTLRS